MLVTGFNEFINRAFFSFLPFLEKLVSGVADVLTSNEVRLSCRSYSLSPHVFLEKKTVFVVSPG